MRFTVAVTDYKLNCTYEAKLVLGEMALVVKVPIDSAPMEVVGCEDYSLTWKCTDYRITIGWRCLDWIRAGWQEMTVTSLRRQFTFRFLHGMHLGELRDKLIEKKVIRLVTNQEIDFCISPLKHLAIRRDFLAKNRELQLFYISIYDAENAQQCESRITKAVRWLKREHKELLQ